MIGILVDITKCTGCEKCVHACVESHDLDTSDADADRATTRDGLSARRWSTLVPVEQERFARKSCMHCVDPNCVAACLVGGIEKTPEGPVIYDPDKCIGCRYCMLACPFHIPRYEWDSAYPFMRKCDLCFDRVQANRLPACVEACPEKALTFGNREELLVEAHSRIRHHPERYLDRVWGETEWGGTSMLYISDVDLSSIGWPQAGEDAIPSLTDPLIAKTPVMGIGVAAGLCALSWIIRRRNRLAAIRATGAPEEVDGE